MATKGISPENVVKDIKRKTRRVFNAEEKNKIAKFTIPANLENDQLDYVYSHMAPLFDDILQRLRCISQRIPRQVYSPAL